jgi:hypothetical protein
MLTHVNLVPSLFRQTLISSGKQREATSSEIAGQITYPQVRRPSSEVRAVLRRGRPATRGRARTYAGDSAQGPARPYQLLANL